VKIFTDSSVLLAVCGSPTGASRQVLRIEESERWKIIATPYVDIEVTTNLPELARLRELEAGEELEPAILDIVLKRSALQRHAK